MNISIAQALRKPDAKSRERVKRINRKILRIVRKTVIKVQRVLRKVKDPKVRGHLETTLGLTDRVAGQTEERLSGGKPTDKVVSLADPGARSIVKGKLANPVEFGRVGQITQDESGYFTQYGVHNGNPGDVTLLPGIVEKHKRQFPRAHKVFAADMVFSSNENHKLLKARGVRRIGMAWRGIAPPDIRAKQQRAWFKALMAFRALHPGGKNYVISPVAGDGYVRRSAGLEFIVCDPTAWAARSRIPRLRPTLNSDLSASLLQQI